MSTRPILEFTWLGQGGFLFVSDTGVRMAVDPYLSNSVERIEGFKRLVNAPIPADSLNANIVLCTHDHLDHTDPDTLCVLRKERTYFVGPGSSCSHFEKMGIDSSRIFRLDRGGRTNFCGVSILATYAEHTADSIGYLMDFCGVRVYISGDSLFSPHLFKVKELRPDITFICINGKMGNMSAKEAAEVVKAIGSQIAIPMHYGMFAENTANPQEFVDALSDNQTKHRVIVMEHGGRYSCFRSHRGGLDNRMDIELL